MFVGMVQPEGQCASITVMDGDREEVVRETRRVAELLRGNTGGPVMWFVHEAIGAGMEGV